MRRQIPLLITFAVGVIMLFEAFIPHPPFDQLNESLSITFDVLAAFAFVLGGGNLAKIHLSKISRSEPGWGYSAVTMAGFFLMLAIGLFKVGGPSGIKHALEAEGSWFQAAYDYCFLPLSATTFSLLAFFVASASYRAFRAKNREATLLLIAALIILLGRTLVGTALTETLPGSLELLFGALLAYLAWEQFRSKRWISLSLIGTVAAFVLARTLYGYLILAGGGDFYLLTVPDLVNWIMVVPQLAGQRAIMIGICLGIISMSLRLILGVERSYLGSDND